MAKCRLFVRHSVADYGAWRKGYDSAVEFQKSMGVTAEAVYRSVDNPNDLTVWHDFDSIEAAKTFVGDPRLAAALQEIGVQGEPQIWFVQET